MVVSYIPRRYRNVAFKLLVLAAFVYLISIALSLSQSDSYPTAGILNRLRVKHEPDSVVSVREQHQVVEEMEDSREVTEDATEDEDEEYDTPEPPPPVDPKAPGEMGKPYKIDKPTGEVKKAIDKGWKDNAYNQYVSDLISLHRLRCCMSRFTKVLYPCIPDLCQTTGTPGAGSQGGISR